MTTTNPVRRAIAEAATYLGISHAEAERLPARVIEAVTESDPTKHPAFPALMAQLRNFSEHDRAEVLRFAMLLASLGRVPTDEERAVSLHHDEG